MAEVRWHGNHDWRRWPGHSQPSNIKTTTRAHDVPLDLSKAQLNALLDDSI